MNIKNITVGEADKLYKNCGLCFIGDNGGYKIKVEKMPGRNMNKKKSRVRRVC